MRERLGQVFRCFLFRVFRVFRVLTVLELNHPRNVDLFLKQCLNPRQMKPWIRRLALAGLPALFSALLVPLRLCAAGAPPASCAPALEQAAEALSRSEFAAARQQFRELAHDDSTPVFIRSLAAIGEAEASLGAGDRAAALQQFISLANNSAFPRWARDLAERRATETKRMGQGLPGRDPEAYRLKLPELPEPGLVLHVSPGGNASGDGTDAKPYGSLAKARDAIREVKKKRGALPKGGVKIILADGVYKTAETFRLSAEDSGAAEAPIVYEAVSREAVFQGGIPLRGWRPIQDAVVRDRLDPSVRDQVLEVDLKENGVADFGDATALKRRPELFVNGAPQTLARWPNEGFVHTGEILGTNTFKVWGSISGCKDGKFRFEEDRPKRWLDEPDVRLYGYWFWDWFEEYQKVASIDPGQGSFTLTQPYSNYGYRKGQRYYAVNVFRELDAPGEWYLDRRSAKLYWCPPANVDPANAESVLSVRTDPFIELQNASHVVLLGFTFQNARGDGIHVTGGSDCLIAGCTLERLGGDAIIIDSGKRHTVFGCTMSTLGCGGMRINGGDRKTLTAGNHVVENCTVSDISRIKRTYAPAVHLDGCGNRVAHNLFERIPSSAMRIEGNDHLIELNQVRNVVQESDDQGGIDMFGNPLYRGVVIRWNRWSDIIGGTECGAAGIRLDDMISGIVLYGNLFERCGAVQFGGVQIHGGKDNIVDGNVFLDCFSAFSFSRWDDARWLKSIESFLPQATQEPYANRYPDLARIRSDANVNFLSRNLVLGCKNILLRDGGVQKSALWFVSAEPTRFDTSATDPATLSHLRRVLFEPLPVAEMGTYAHPLRASPPHFR